MARDDIAGRIELRRRLDLSSYQAITQLAEEILEGADESQRQIIHAAIWVSLQLAEEPRYSVETSLDPQEPFVQISRSGKGRTNYQRDFYDVGKRQSELQHAQIAGERMDIGDGWKLHISIANKDRETMGLAWAVTANLLHEYGIPSAKVLRSDQLNRGDGGGKQITIYLGSTDLVQKYQLAIVPFVQALDTGLSEIIGLQALCDENNTI